MAQVIFQGYVNTHKLVDIQVSSSGIHAIDGAPMSTNAVIALQELFEVNPNYVVPQQFGSTPFDHKFIQEFDLIVCMSQFHKQAIGDYDNVILLGDISGGGDVSDPYGGDIQEYINVARHFEDCCQVVFDKLLELIYKNKQV
jgi:protein-tyrosine-phosphatase